MACLSPIYICLLLGFNGNQYPTQWRDESAGSKDGVLQCTQRPGDLLFVPNLWGRGFINLATSVAYTCDFEWIQWHTAFVLPALKEKATAEGSTQSTKGADTHGTGNPEIEEGGANPAPGKGNRAMPPRYQPKNTEASPSGPPVYEPPSPHDRVSNDGSWRIGTSSVPPQHPTPERVNQRRRPPQQGGRVSR